MLKTQIFINGQDKTAEIEKFIQNGDYFEIKFFNTAKIYKYHKDKIFIKKPNNDEIKVDFLFGYFKKLALCLNLNSQNAETKQISEFLVSNYEKIENLNPNSVAFKILSGKFSINLSNSNNIIFPFGFNLSQFNAVHNAFESEISIIQGPPGTGKTQTILNIIANAIMQNKSVAVVSNNNLATKNVFEKLEKDGIDFVVAQLGNAANKTEFLNSQKEIPHLKPYLLNSKEINEISQNLVNLQKNLHYKLQLKNELCELEKRLYSLQIEYKHYQNYAINVEIKDFIDDIENSKSSNFILDLNVLLENFDEKRLNFVEFIKEKLSRFGFKFKTIILKNLLKKYPKTMINATLEKKFYEITIAQISEKISNSKAKLVNFDDDMKKYSSLAMKLLKANLAKKYQNSRKIYYANELKLNSDKFILDYPVVLSTTHSLQNSLNRNFLYDFVIIDEASQVDICTGILSFCLAKNIVVVGDLKQLPNIVTNDIAEATNKLFDEFGLPSLFNYKENSLLSFVSSIAKNAPSVLLKEHYRCNRQIIEFCNQKFYNGNLIVVSQNNTQKPLVIYQTPPGNHAKNNINQRQIDIIKNEIMPNLPLNSDIGIITPYRNQAKALQDEFKDTKIKAATVDSFQGRENKIIILSTVDNEISEFTDNPNRLNVAISRAIDKLIVIINSNEISSDKNINELVSYIKYNNCDIIESSTHSVFDYLYKCNQAKRENFLKNKKIVSKFDSENLMYLLICDVLANEFKKQNLSVCVHIALNKIIKNLSNLNSREMEFVLGGLSHVDFLIYKNIDKSPLLCIEVDGASYHEQGSKQSQRDKMKDEIFQKCGLRLIRFSTKGSEERKILINAIKSAL